MPPTSSSTAERLHLAQPDGVGGGADVDGVLAHLHDAGRELLVVVDGDGTDLDPVTLMGGPRARERAAGAGKTGGRKFLSFWGRSYNCRCWFRSLTIRCMLMINPCDGGKSTLVSALKIFKQADIFAMAKKKSYLVVIMDWYSRYVLS